ncbi:hypothetical protein NQZ68_006222 [Dissostichus eleginoides]|nr:hypothetical protein NQZ68_006222 [Dissostichus eleginoides]
MTTKKLAKELGLLRQRSQSTNGSKTLLSNQIFAYLIVIDFESTCWKEKTNYGQEIIEFPAVLLNTSTGEIESEFHTYVQPQERPLLSEFCTELTGIKQMQVEAGIPLQICLSRFNRWLQKMQVEKGLVFPNGQQKSSAPSPSQKPCAFVTWSDWDLGVCLQYECKRKQLHKPDVLNSWIDLRGTYRMFYDKKPKGLNGALQDLGIQFAGREHSGLDDSRNTACLAVRMMRDGCVMKITRSLEKAPSMVKPMFGNTTADSKKEKSKTDEEKNTSNTEKPSSSKIPPKLLKHKPFVPEKTSTPFTSFIKPRAVVTQHPKPKETPRSSVTIYTNATKTSVCSTGDSFSKTVLASLSTNSLNQSSFSISKRVGQRITSPLCGCGRRAKRQLVSNGGPNHGRGFFCCPVRRSGSGGRIQKGCEFFKWASAVMKSSLVVAPAVGSSVSLCQINSSLSRPPPLTLLR